MLGIHGMLTQKQSVQVESDKAWDSLKGSGLRKYKGGINIYIYAVKYINIIRQYISKYIQVNWMYKQKKFVNK